MKLKHRLSLYSLLVFSILTLLISGLIYTAYYVQMERMEQHALENKSLLAAIYYLERDELSSLEHANIQAQLQKTISRRNILVFDSLDRTVAGEMDRKQHFSKEFLNMVRITGKGQFSNKEFFYNAIYYPDNQGDFVVIAREEKSAFNEQMATLMKILMAAFFAGLLIIYLFSRFLGYIAYQPIVKLISQIKDRDSKNFDQPIEVDRSYAEIRDLGNTYNHFVDRIAQTFSVQKNFIDYVSHELRTPITAILGTLEVTDQRQRSQEEYAQVLQQLKQFTNDLQETLEQMMLLSGAKTNFEFAKVHLDELIWQAIENAVLYHQAKIDVKMEVSPELLIWDGNASLLGLAVGNLIENALKYSDNAPVMIELMEQERHLEIRIQDSGIGIPAADLLRVKENFFRASNSKAYSGKGIGLSMAFIIFKMHHIHLDIQSDSKGTLVRLTF